jgi:hypothetical protein
VDGQPCVHHQGYVPGRPLLQWQRVEQHRRYLGRVQQRVHRQRDNRPGREPSRKGTPGGGSGGAIYTDGDIVPVAGTVMRDNDAARGEGGAIFFVVDAGHGVLKIEYSTLHHNPAGGYQNAPGILEDVDQVCHEAGRDQLDRQLSGRLSWRPAPG